MRHITLIIAVLALAIAAPAIAGKGGNGNGNGGGSDSGGTASPKSYSPTLDVTMSYALTSDSSASMPYTIAGCGYDSSFGAVTLVVYTPVSAGFTSQMPDAGCISVSNFSTQGPGTYQVEALQTVHQKQSVVASTSFTVP
jgi:hypothetical protein